MNYVCYFFGHTGEFYDGRYHVCSRCGLHEYYHSSSFGRLEDGPDYDRSAILYRHIGWPIKAQWYRIAAWYTRHTRRPDNGDELPF